MTDAAAHDYWPQALAELSRCPARPEIEPLPLRSTPFATLYGVRLTSLGPYRLFGYLSIPKGTGPFPAIYYAPKYQSVLEIIPQGTANLQRSRYVTFSLAGRGQRNADSPHAAMFPGLLPKASTAPSHIRSAASSPTASGGWNSCSRGARSTTRAWSWPATTSPLSPRP
jgi:cephalosporin-C deacetylase